MDLKAYIDGGRGNGVALSRALCIPASYLSQLAAGVRTISPERAVAIEHATKGAVECEALVHGGWVRIPDPDWPHPQGRPLRDYAIPKETAHA